MLNIHSSYYAPNKGIGYNMMRIPIGGCDFDLEPWAYNEQPINDVKLSNFVKLDERDVHRVYLIWFNFFKRFSSASKINSDLQAIFIRRYHRLKSYRKLQPIMLSSLLGLPGVHRHG